MQRNLHLLPIGKVHIRILSGVTMSVDLDLLMLVVDLKHVAALLGPRRKLESASRSMPPNRSGRALSNLHTVHAGYFVKFSTRTRLSASPLRHGFRVPGDSLRRFVNLAVKMLRPGAFVDVANVHAAGT